ncbi:MAG: dihydrolipoamide acetyltransferase family protein [Flavobacteriales bacterium]|nr:dihydrolipoamide acetyltransferase family protein [Flavobacteriales bacterium]
MAEFKVELPKMGESVAEATITTWLKAVGDTIEEDEPIVEIATDKVDSEVPAPCSGILKEILFQEGDVVPVGSVFAVISNEVSEEANPVEEVINVTENLENNSKSVEKEILKPIEENTIKSDEIVFKNSTKFYSPLVKSIAKKESISIDELENISGTGANERVTKSDMLSFLENRKNTPTNTANKSIKQPIINSKPTTSVSGNDEIVEMDRMRKMIADHMVNSVHTAPHVTSFVEADVTNLVKWRNKVKKSFEEKEGQKLTFTPIFIEAIAKALRDFPEVNSSIDGDSIIIKSNINIGMATALPSGNLIVPVIKNADQLNLVGLAKNVNDLANRAKNSQLKPDEISGGTYTVSNVGTFGNVMGTPIINQPQSAILALGAIKKKPAVIETESGDLIGIRHLMFLSHSYDHRNIDGALGGRFVRKVADYLENFDINRTI